MSIASKLGIAAVLVVVGAGGFFLWHRSADPLTARIADAKSLGLPVDPSDLKGAKLPDKQNGAIEVHQALDDLELSENGKADMKLITTAWSANSTESDRQAAIAACRRLTPELALIIAATKKPHCQFPINWADTAHATFPELVAMKGFVRAFCLLADDKCRHGDTEGALSTISIAYRATRLVSENQVLINLLVQCACEAMVERALARLIDMKRRDGSFLKALQKLHDSFGPIPDYRVAFKTEAVYSLHSVDQVKTLKDVYPQASQGATEITASDKSQVKTIMLERYTAFFKDLPKTDSDWGAVHAIADKVAQSSTDSDDKLSKVVKVMIASFDFHLWSTVLDAVIRCEERRKLTATSILLFLSRNQGQRFPKSLKGYGKKAIDPFSTHPFVFQTQGNGFTLYGFGTNRIDDGGDALKDDVVTFN